MTEKARRATISLAGIELEVFMLPDGSYVMSQSQVGEATGKQEFYVRRFLGGKQPEALPDNDYTPGIFNIAPGLNERRGGHRFKPVSIDLANEFWLDQAIKGNVKAQALAYACMQESLKRRVDNAFIQKLTEEHYEKEAANDIMGWLKTRAFLKQSHAAFQMACSKYGFNAAFAHDAITVAITGLKACEHRMLDLVGDDEDTGLDHVQVTPALQRIAYVKLMFAKYRRGDVGERVARAVAETYKAGY